MRAWRFGWGAPLAKSRNPAAYLLGKIEGDDIKQAVALYRSDDLGATWKRLNDASQGWGQASVVNGNRQTPGRVYVGTKGRDIFYGDMSAAMSTHAAARSTRSARAK